jgi:hypothetical protein
VGRPADRALEIAKGLWEESRSRPAFNYSPRPNQKLICRAAADYHNFLCCGNTLSKPGSYQTTNEFDFCAER